MEIHLSSIYTNGLETEVLKNIQNALNERDGNLNIKGMRINPNLTIGLTLSYDKNKTFDFNEISDLISKNMLDLNILLILQKIEHLDKNNVYFNFKIKKNNH